MKQTITAIVPAKNEEQNITRCLKSLAWCDRVVVIDSGTDSTGEIAKKLGATVIEKKHGEIDDFTNVQKDINEEANHVKTDWILRIDADEEVTPELKKELEEMLKTQSEYVAYTVHRNPYFLGAFLRGGDWPYDRLVRLYKKGAAFYDTSTHVHEQYVVNGTIGQLEGALNHYSHPTMQILRRKFHSYTTIQIQDTQLSLVHAIYNLFTQPPYVFLRWLIWHHGYRDGWRGLVAGGLRGWYEFLLYKKYIAYKLRRLRE